MRYERAWTKSVVNDLKQITRAQFDELDKVFESILDDPVHNTKKVEGFAGQNVRSLRFHDHRLILQIDSIGLTVYALLFGHRKEVYEKKARDKLKNLLLNIATVSKTLMS